MTAEAKQRRAARPALALAWGAATHGLFALGVGSMVLGLFTGLQLAVGAVPQPLAIGANLLLALMFPLLHSWLLTRHGQRLLARLAPAGAGQTLAPSTYAMLGGLQLLALFWLWTPSGVELWRAEGPLFWLMCIAFAGAWALLGLAILNAGVGLQSGFIGWWALLRGRRPAYPDMPDRGLFRVVRQPIYIAFALTLWTPPVWTADQVLLAVLWTAYCVAAPMLKERRFAARYGARWQQYRERVPYWVPDPRLALSAKRPGSNETDRVRKGELGRSTDA